MKINEQKIAELISQGEGISLEFKTCRNQINRDVYETVCAFLNRHGGTLLLGVNDSGKITGIDPETVAQIKKDFVTAINNPQKLTPAAYLSVEEIEAGPKKILKIYVPESSQVHRCNGRIYDRNEDGDFLTSRIIPSRLPASTSVNRQLTVKTRYIRGLMFLS